jgi:serine/threonine-protein kinase
MNEAHDPQRTVDEVRSVPAESLDVGLAAGFGRAEPPRSSLEASQRPVLLREAQGESDHVVRPNSDAMPPKEETGDRYQLMGEIARGGMGAVLRGRDVDLGRDLAVKVLLEKHADRPEVLRRFIEEAQIGGQLQHPGVVPVYDIGRFGNRPFFTMKLVKGKTLAHMLVARADPSQDRPRLLGIALQVCQTLAFAHAKGVIHRDLKPANIMVGAFGEVQVMDWGLAKVLAEGGSADEEKSRERERPEAGTLIRTARSTGSAGTFGTVTEAGSLLGTLAYMPPEQANGDLANLDRRADVFGLGAILCEVLTGKPPYVGRSSEEVRRKAANGDLADATARLDGCGADEELIRLTKACLCSEAVDRPKDAQEVADSLRRYLDGVQERLRRAELAEAEAKAKAGEEAKRRRLTLALAATVLLALTLGGGGWLWVKNEHEARQAQVTRDLNEALNRATALREKAKEATTGGTTLFAQAREQVQRALALVQRGPADAVLLARVRQLQAELDEEEKDRALVTALDEAALAQAETLAGQNRFASERAVPKFREAFAAYGMPAGEGDPAAAAERIRNRPPAVREAILAALEEWDGLAGNRKPVITEPHRDWLRAVRQATQRDDAWGRQLRAVIREKDPKKQLAALEALAKSADVKSVPSRRLTRLAVQVRPAEAVDLLRRARRQYPADFWVNHHLGIALAHQSPPDRVEAVRFLTAAVTLRPDSLGAQLNLGVALLNNGQIDEGIACFKKAIDLDPKYDPAHSNLGVALARKGLVEEAIACGRKAIALAPKDALAHNNLGVSLERKGKVDEAVACYQKAIELDPKDATAHHSLGLALKDKSQLDEAIVYFRRAIDLDPKYAPAHSNLGVALERKGQMEEAIACYHKAIALDPKDAVAHTNLGIRLAGKGQVKEAIACYHKAIALDPKLALAHDSLGLALHGKGRVDEAIECWERAIALDPKGPKPHNNLGKALLDKGQVDAAIECCHKAIAIDPKYAKAHTSLGVALERKGQVDKAIACYRQAALLDPKLAEAHFGLGNVLAVKGKVEQAIASYRQATALDPKDARAHTNLGVALAGRDQVEEAIACYQKAIALDPKDARAHNNLGLALAGKGQVEEAIVCYRKALVLDPKFALAHFNLGIARERKGQVDEAVACYRQAVLLDPKYAQAHFRLAVAQERKGQEDEAIACWRKGIALAPKDAHAHYRLGGALERKGQVEEAIACYRLAIELDPNDARAHTNLGALLCDRKREYDEAIRCFRKALELDPKDAKNHENLGIALNGKGRVDEAIACYKKAIEIDPKHAQAHFNLGVALTGKGRVEEAIASYRQAVALDPRSVIAHGALGEVLLSRGRFAEARGATARALELLPEHPLRAAVARQLQMSEQLVSLEPRLPRLLTGEDRPASAQEGLVIATMCRHKGMHAAAVRFSADAFAARPGLADFLPAQHRYNAACSAVLAAAGKGEDAAKLDDKERARLRKQALDWLRADLVLRGKQLESGKPADRAAVQQTLRHWQQDTDLAGIRDKETLGKLPAEEQKVCTQLWADVAALLKKAETPAKKESK